MAAVVCFIPQNIAPGDYSNFLTSALQLSVHDCLFLICHSILYHCAPYWLLLASKSSKYFPLCFLKLPWVFWPPAQIILAARGGLAVPRRYGNTIPTVSRSSLFSLVQSAMGRAAQRQKIKTVGGETGRFLLVRTLFFRFTLTCLPPLFPPILEGDETYLGLSVWDSGFCAGYTLTDYNTAALTDCTGYFISSSKA